MYSMGTTGEPSRLDTEVAVRCFDFRWFASGRTNKKTGKEYCSLHVPSSWEKHGWIRWNFDPSREELPRGTIWPEGEYEPFVDWSACVGKEFDPPYRGTEWSGLPPFSQDWRACGMVIEWLTKQGVDFTVNTYNHTISYEKVVPVYEGISTVNGTCNGCVSTVDCDLPEGFCRVAIEVAQKIKIDFPDTE